MRRSSLTSLIALFTFSLCGASVAEAAYSAMLSGTTATFTGDNASDTIIFEQVGGLMKHNRFTAGDTDFASDFDFDSGAAGLQTLAAAFSSIVIVNTGDGNDTVIVGTAVAPALTVAGQFTVDGAGGNDAVIWNDSTDPMGRDIDLEGAPNHRVFVPAVGSVTYGTAVEVVIVFAGSGADDIDVTSTSPASRSINAGGGNDVIDFGDGASLNGGNVDGGAEIDSLTYSTSTTPVVVNLGSTASSLVATLGADQEVPSNTTPATGTATLNYNASLKTFDIVVTVDGIEAADVTGFHLHTAAFGINGPIIIDFPPLSPLTPTPGGFTFTANAVPVPAGAEASLLGGLTYVNVHTADFAGGVIRGQVFPNVLFTATPGSATGTGGIVNFENVIGGSADDRLVGSIDTNVIVGNAGNDIIVASRGNDSVIGGPDNDVIAWSNGDGTDVMEGADGNDVVQVNGALSGDDVFTIGPNGARIRLDRTVLAPFSLDIGTVESLTVLGIDGNDQMTVLDLSATGLSTLRLGGLSGNDTITASGLSPIANVVISGGTGNDMVTGSLGPDSIFGGPDDDVIIGSLGVDTIDGGDGTDDLRGGDGIDILRGGPGDDIVTWSPGDDDDVIEGDTGTDTVLFNGANVAETIAIEPNGARARLTRNVANVVLDIGTSEVIRVLGLGADDIFNVIPLVDASIDINGGPQSIADVLNFNGQNLVVVHTPGPTAGTGTITPVGRQPLMYADVETVNLANPPPTIAISAASVLAEGNAGTAAMSFTVTLSPPSVQTVMVQVNTLNGSATSGTDFVAVNQVLTFMPGATSQPLVVPITGDTMFEPDETFVVLLSNPVNTLLGPSQGTATIVDDDPVPAISVNDVAIAEGQSGTKVLTFTVTLTPASGFAATVNYTTADATATNADYLPAIGTLTFNPGETVKPVAVTILGDTTVEGNETFLLNLSAPTNATLADLQGVGTITEDEDLTPLITITDATGAEGNAGSSPLAFTVALSAPSQHTVTVLASTLNGSATPGQDYTALVNQVLTFMPGVTSLPLQVSVIGDGTFESNETVVVVLTNPVNALLGDDQGTGTIANDDPVPSLSVNDVAILEGHAGTKLLTFTVALTPASHVAASVNFATADGSATNADYMPASGALTFNPGETSKPVAVTIIGDMTVEGSETFVLNLSGPTNASLGDPQGVGTLTEDDVKPLITITDPASASIVATSPFLTVRGTASDDTAVAAVNWTSDRGGAGTAEGTTSWEIRNIPLQAGVNVITVTAVDTTEQASAGTGDQAAPERQPRATASATLTVTVNEFVYYLAEGATGSFFDLDILIANPGAAPAPAIVTFLKEDGSTLSQNVTIPANTRLTIPVETIAGLDTGAVSTVVRSTEAKPLVVERTMFWDAGKYGSHGGNAVEGAKRRWLFAEGSQGFFDTFVLLANANATAANVTLTFLTEFDGPVVVQRTVGPNARRNVWALEVPQLIGKAFSIVVDSDQPIIAERAMYFPSAVIQDPAGRRLFEGGHESAGVSEPATRWFHAEGATGAFFDTYVLVGNPNNVPATAVFTWLLDTGETVVKTKTIPANSRLTVFVEAEDPRLANAPAVSTTVASDVPVISERAMYWPGTFTQWLEAHDSFGATDAGTKWGLAEGRVGGQALFDTFILLANAETTTASVTVTYLRENGTTLVKQYTVGPTSRFNIWVNANVPEMVDERFGAIIQVTNGVPITVERTMYNTSGGQVFAGGSSATATRLP